jgi:hypothetical protein
MPFSSSTDNSSLVMENGRTAIVVRIEEKKEPVY